MKSRCRLALGLFAVLFPVAACTPSVTPVLLNDSLPDVKRRSVSPKPAVSAGSVVRRPERLTGSLWVPARLLSDAGGSIVSNNSGGLVANNGGNLSGASANMVARGAGYRLLKIDELPFEGATVYLADAKGARYVGVPTVQSDAKGEFVFPTVPAGLTYQVVATIPTTKGEVRLSALCLPGQPSRVSLASTVVATQLLENLSGVMGELPSVDDLSRCIAAVTSRLTAEDGKLVFVADQNRLAAEVMGRAFVSEPGVKRVFDALTQHLRQVTEEAAVLEQSLRAPAAASPEQSPGVPTPAVITSTPTPQPSLSSLPLKTPEPTVTALTSPSPGFGLLGTVSTLAGAMSGYADGIGSFAKFEQPTDGAVDSSGRLLVADQGNHRIRRIGPDGLASTVAGSGVSGYQDGPGATAQFNQPDGLAVDGVGNIYVADSKNDRIRLVAPDGSVSTWVGSTKGYLDDTGQAAQFNNPTDVAVDRMGNLYVADQANHRIRKVTPDRIVTTLAGSTEGNVDDIGDKAKFFGPTGVTVDSSGNVYVADWLNHSIRKITPAGEVTTLAGKGSGYADDVGTAARFAVPTDLAVDRDGNVYVADSGNHRIRKIKPTGEVSTVTGSTAGFADGAGANAKFNTPDGVALDSSGAIFVADRNNKRIRRIQ